MLNTTEFYVFRLNVPAEVNQAIDNEYTYEKYDATDGDGCCFFDDILSIWRQNDDWYCAIHFNDSRPGVRVKDCMLDAFMTIYDYAGVPFDERTIKINPTLLFHNNEIV